jgi:hypothetical protein
MNPAKTRSPRIEGDRAHAGRSQLMAANTKFLQALQAQWLQSRLHCTETTARKLARLIFGEARQ